MPDQSAARTAESARGGPSADATDAPTPVDEMSFEAAMGELEAIVDRLERGAVALDESISFYERGEALKARCDFLLKNAEMRVEKVRLKGDGAPVGTAPLDERDDVPF